MFHVCRKKETPLTLPGSDWNTPIATVDLILLRQANNQLVDPRTTSRDTSVNSKCKAGISCSRLGSVSILRVMCFMGKLLMFGLRHLVHKILAKNQGRADLFIVKPFGGLVLRLQPQNGERKTVSILVIPRCSC